MNLQPKLLYMFGTAFLRNGLFKNYFHYQSRFLSKTHDIKRIRNVGIIAHIDAGKTTTTERMLYYSGFMFTMGEVHDGDTVMDYMAQERERGITINSAAITFNWKKHKINLVDTPGHVDFTIEVERSLCVLDGGVVILDSSAGVEVQTLTVWNQANHHEVPCIIYLNKMDKPTSNFEMCLTSIQDKLKIKTLVMQLPLGVGKSFSGILDIISMKTLVWNKCSALDGTNFTVACIEENSNWYILAEKQREKLIEDIADLDDEFADKFILEGISSITEVDLFSAVKRITLRRTAVPIFCGSSYKNIGVQPLMDAMLLYLPNPEERTNKMIGKNNDCLHALAFKIIHDKKKGPLTFLRLYSGSIQNGQKLYNINRGHFEKITNLMIPLANDFESVSSVLSGNIVVVTGLKSAITGDIFSSLVKQLESDNFFNILRVPDPVFFCSIEPPSPGAQNQLEYALKCLTHEDPTFKVEQDEELGQIIISGMGELHIDIIKEKIRRDYGIDVYLGNLQIAYRETLVERYVYTHVHDKSLGNAKQYIKITLEIHPFNNFEKFKEVKVVITKDNNLGKIYPDHLKAINAGVFSSLMHGPILGFPVIGNKVSLHWLEVGKGTTLPMVSAATSHCIQHILKDSQLQLLEPIMKISITAAKGCAGRILNDLSQKRCQITNMNALSDVEIITGRCPLSELMGYSTVLRAITSGNCAFTLEFDSYEKMDIVEQSKAVEKVTGFYPS